MKYLDSSDSVNIREDLGSRSDKRWGNKGKVILI